MANNRQCCIWVSKLELVDAMEAHLEKDMTFNSIHKRVILEGSNIFRKFHTPPSPPLESQLDPSINAVSPVWFLTTVIRLTHPRQNKRHSDLKMKMTPNQDVRWDTKKYASGHAIGVRQTLSRAQSISV